MERLCLDRWASPWLRHQHVTRYRWASAFTKGCRVLDAACGAAYGSRILLDHGARAVDGVDNSWEAFEEARRCGPTEPLRFIVADVTELPLASHRYDAYVSFETLEHVEGDRALLSEAVRVLKPGGKLLCSTPNRELLSPGNSIQDRPVNPYHIREYNLEEFQSLLREFFGSIELFGQTPFPHEHRDRLLRIARRAPGLAIRLHQIRNILGIPWEKPEKHFPARLPFGGEPEVLIAVCSAPGSLTDKNPP
ncbi:MAG: class I SAM-dependent methyltransferase, partial [Acidobacteriota bacterium]